MDYYHGLDEKESKKEPNYNKVIQLREIYKYKEIRDVKDSEYLSVLNEEGLKGWCCVSVNDVPITKCKILLFRKKKYKKIKLHKL